jgi:hypothetical protein
MDRNRLLWGGVRVGLAAAAAAAGQRLPSVLWRAYGTHPDYATSHAITVRLRAAWPAINAPEQPARGFGTFLCMQGILKGLARDPLGSLKRPIPGPPRVIPDPQSGSESPTIPAPRS